MEARILVAPAGGGKTHYAVSEVRRAAQALRATPHVVVASALQARAFRRRLAREGGAIGVQVVTFEGLYRLCLGATDALYTRISDPVQHRVIRSVVRELPLVHYAPLTHRPGFVQVLKDVIDKLKAARVDPECFSGMVAAQVGDARLQELADIYAAYQDRLRGEAWADAAGLGWLTAEALEGSDCSVGADWPLLLVDGFDDFTPVQLAVLAPLASRVGRTIVTLTGASDGGGRPLVYRRFDRTRRELEETLGVRAEPLSKAASRDAGLGPSAVGGDLPERLFRSEAPQVRSDGSLELVEAAHPAGEVRAALRWLKAEMVEGGMSPAELALVARDITAYRPFVRQVASEFGLPVHFHAGEPLKENPAVGALIDLLRLMLPGGDAVGGAARPGRGDGEPHLPPRLVIEAWRSPYFDWSGPPAAREVAPAPDSAVGEASGPVGIEPGDAEALGVLVRRGRVIGGLEQWEGAFEALGKNNGSTRSPRSTRSPGSARSPGHTDYPGTTVDRDFGLAPGDVDPEEGEGPTRALTPRRVQELHNRFRRFVERLRPPQGEHSARHFVAWLETLMGPDPEPAGRRFPRPAAVQRESAASLGVVARARQGDWSVAERDVAALRRLKGVLRGLVWAEEALDSPPLTFPAFVTELVGAIEAAVYHLPRASDGEEILAADLVALRGVPFRAVAVLGLAEGFFPAPKSEDPLLLDADREALGLPLRPSTESAEVEYFYETVAAPREKLLLTRPRMTEDGAPWEASPFWEEVVRLVDVDPAVPVGSSGTPPSRAASWPELLHCAAAVPEARGLWAWLSERAPGSVAALNGAVAVHTWRSRRADSPFDGGLHGLGEHFKALLHRRYPWSASRLEAYRTCPFYFFVSKMLRLEPRAEPAEGLDALQRGTLYHDILEQVYQAVEDPADLDQLLGALPGVAARVLADAPERQGFRETAWWAQTRQEMVEDVWRSLEALHDDELRGDFVPVQYEAAFGLWGKPPLVVGDERGEDAFILRGLIDRVDRDGEGQVRIIDYKTGGPSRYGNTTLRRGEKIQLPLYALAARDALGLGQPVSGFYWHVRHAEPSPLKLEDFGPEDAIQTAVAHAWEAIHGAREGRFRPAAPRGGCPSYCPAVTFCWQYERGYAG